MSTICNIAQYFLGVCHPKKVISTHTKQQTPAAVNEAQRQLNAFREEFTRTVSAIKSVQPNPSMLSRENALKLAQLTSRFGVAIYANKEVCSGITNKSSAFKASFQYSLTVLKTSIALHQYAFGLSDRCPVVVSAESIDDLYTHKKIVKINSAMGNAAIQNMSPSEWAEKANSLDQKQHFDLVNSLRYTSGAEGYLASEKPSLSERIEHVFVRMYHAWKGIKKHSPILLATAEAILKQAQNNKDFNQKEVNHELAELYYNDMTGLYALQAEELEAKGKPELAAAKREALSQLWETCVSLSKEPDKMRFRCDNKRTFIEKLTLEQEEALRVRSLKGHLELPEERQNKLLIALSFHNLSHLFARKAQLEQDPDKKAAFTSHARIAASTAARIAVECQQAGINNIQFDSIFAQAAIFASSVGD